MSIRQAKATRLSTFQTRLDREIGQISQKADELQKLVDIDEIISCVQAIETSTNWILTNGTHIDNNPLGAGKPQTWRDASIVRTANIPGIFGISFTDTQFLVKASDEVGALKKFYESDYYFDGQGLARVKRPEIFKPHWDGDILVMRS